MSRRTHQSWYRRGNVSHDYSANELRTIIHKAKIALEMGDKRKAQQILSVVR